MLSARGSIPVAMSPTLSTASTTAGFALNGGPRLASCVSERAPVQAFRSGAPPGGVLGNPWMEGEGGAVEGRYQDRGRRRAKGNSESLYRPLETLRGGCATASR